jgi:hypothetical protein
MKKFLNWQRVEDGNSDLGNGDADEPTPPDK